MERKFKLGEKVVVNGTALGVIVGIDLKAEKDDLPYLVSTSNYSSRYGKTVQEYVDFYGPDLIISDDVKGIEKFTRAEWEYEEDLQPYEEHEVKPPMLMDGYIVTTRERGNAIILGGRLKGVKHLYNKSGLNNVNYYDDNLNSAGGASGVISSIDKEFDIMKVYEIEDMYKYTIEELINDLPEDGVNCIWTREKEVKSVEVREINGKRREKLEETMDKIIDILEDFLKDE